MKRAILSCNGLDKPEGSVAREVAIRAADATGGEIICPVLLNRAPARYKKALTESSLIVVDGCSTRCATKLATAVGGESGAEGAGVGRRESLRPGAGIHTQPGAKRIGACSDDRR